MLCLYKHHALKALRASVGDVEGHKVDCILALRTGQALKIHSLHTIKFMKDIYLPVLISIQVI
jgi:hypothetical protein